MAGNCGHLSKRVILILIDSVFSIILFPAPPSKKRCFKRTVISSFKAYGTDAAAASFIGKLAGNNAGAHEQMTDHDFELILRDFCIKSPTVVRGHGSNVVR